jgi:hypothetical protein
MLYTDNTFQSDAVLPLYRLTINISVHLFIFGAQTLHFRTIYHILNFLFIFVPHSKHCHFKPAEFSDD